MSDLSLRPGLALGPYPERAEPGSGVLERLLVWATACMAQSAGRSTRGFRQINRRVDHHGAALRGRSDADLLAHGRLLGKHLRSKGLTDALVARSFALVRLLWRAGRRYGRNCHPAIAL